MYGDETQVNISSSIADTDLSITQLGDCLHDISRLMINNKLWFNADIFNYYRYIQTTHQNTCFSSTVILNYSITGTLFYNIAFKDIAKLQCVQNCLDSVVTRSPRFYIRVTSELTSLAPFLISHHFQHLCRCLSVFLPENLRIYCLCFLLTKAQRAPGLHLLSIHRVKSHAGNLDFSISNPSLELNPRPCYVIK